MKKNSCISCIMYCIYLGFYDRRTKEVKRLELFTIKAAPSLWYSWCMRDFTGGHQTVLKGRRALQSYYHSQGILYRGEHLRQCAFAPLASITKMKAQQHNNSEESGQTNSAHKHVLQRGILIFLITHCPHPVCSSIMLTGHKTIID